MRTTVEAVGHRSPIPVVHNPVDVARFAAPEGPSTIRSDHGIPETAKVVVSAGRLDPGKGHLDLIDVADASRRPTAARS